MQNISLKKKKFWRHIEILFRVKTSDDKTKLGNQIASISFTIALEILGLYHKWAEEEASQ